MDNSPQTAEAFGIEDVLENHIRKLSEKLSRPIGSNGRGPRTARPSQSDGIRGAIY
jgi:hypothetical protein